MTVPASADVDPAIRSEILEHILRYRMTVVAAACQIPKLRAIGRRRAAGLLNQMYRDGELGRSVLYQKYHYYYLPADQAPKHAHDRGPLSEQAKIRNYALLAFCCLDHQPRTRLTAEELQRYFPDLFRVGLPLNYYVDRGEQQPRLGFARVDTGGRGRWDRVLAKCRDDLRAHLIHPGVQPFLERGAFEIALITTLPRKALRLAEAIAECGDACAKLIRVSVLPELLNLIAPPPSRTSRP